MKTMPTAEMSMFLLFLLLPTIALGGAPVTLITAENSCQEPIWVAAVSAPRSPELVVAATGFLLLPTEFATVSVPSNWSGYLWARTHCSVQQQHFLCLTGDCGSRAVACPRGTPVPLATTVAHFEADPLLEYYSFYVSESTGYNLVVAVVPEGGVGDRCHGTGCMGLYPSKSCPEGLRVLDGHGEIIGCDIAPNELGCFSANYHLQFCACKHYSSTVNNSPDLPGYKPYESPEGSGSEKENSKGSKRSALKIVLGLIGSVVGIGIIFLSMTFGIIPHPGGCCNGNRFNFFFGKVSPTTTITTNEVQLNIKVEVNSK